MSNILDAIMNIIEDGTFEAGRSKKTNNTVNQVGSPLEEYVKDAFSNSFRLEADKRDEAMKKSILYHGDFSNPPDIITAGKDGLVIEVKKSDTYRAELQLNSSYPHRKFSAQDGRINKTCKEKLGDKEWDMLYVVGSFEKGKKAICHLAMVYGSVYCADEKYYKEVDCAVRKAMKGLEKVLQKKRPNIKRDMTTNELGKFIDIDPRKHCKLRVRGMYTYMSPYVVFDQTFKESENIFDLFVVIPKEKFKKFENRDKFCEFAKKNGISVEDKKCQDPNGGAEIICTFIKYEKKRAAELTTMPQSPQVAK